MAVPLAAEVRLGAVGGGSGQDWVEVRFVAAVFAATPALVVRGGLS